MKRRPISSTTRPLIEKISWAWQAFTPCSRWLWRVEAAKSHGMEAVPCLWIEHMTEAEKRAHVIADNKRALNVGWDEEMLAQELQGLLAMADIGFDIGVMGFEVGKIDSLVEDLTPEEPGTRTMTSPPRARRAGSAWATSGNWPRIVWFAATRLPFGRMLSKGRSL